MYDRLKKLRLYTWCTRRFGFHQSPVLDFGKIIIYTSNLRIIRAPQRTPEASRHTLPPVDMEGYPKARERGSRRRAKALLTLDVEEKEGKQISHIETKVMVLGLIILSGVVGSSSRCSVSRCTHVPLSPCLCTSHPFFTLSVIATARFSVQPMSLWQEFSSHNLLLFHPNLSSHRFPFSRSRAATTASLSSVLSVNCEHILMSPHFRSLPLQHLPAARQRVKR